MSTALRDIKQSIKPDIHRHAEKSATIQNIANNPLLAAMEIRLLRKEIRSLHRQIAQTVLSDELAKHGTDLPDNATGNQIRRAVGLMDTPITEALEKGQLHTTKLTLHHFEKNAYSRMNVQLAMQFLSASTAAMIQKAMDDNEIVLNLREKGMYGRIRNLCTHWNGVVDICNGQDGPHWKKHFRLSFQSPFSFLFCAKTTKIIFTKNPLANVVKKHVGLPSQPPFSLLFCAKTKKTVPTKICLRMA
jgi:hypothetical protein